MPKVDVDGIQLEYTESGHGDPLVLVHGSLGDTRNWRFQVGPLSEHYHVIAYSRRYHYPNPPAGDGTDYTFALHGQDLAALITRLGLGPAHVIGQSGGAYTVLCFALAHPDLARTLVLGEPPILPWLERLPGGPPLFAAFMANAWEPARRAFARGDAELAVKAFVDGVSGVPEFEHAPAAARTRMLENADSLKDETESPGYFTPLRCEELRTIQVPVLLVQGELSPKMFHLIVDELEACLPNTERQVIPGASHSMATGNPEAYNQAVLQFLARHS
jgi:pimeloyl-ACP methyl ester carboxylesterase